MAVDNRFSLGAMRRLGQREGLYSLIVPVIVYGSIAFAIWYSMWPYFYYVKNESFLVLGIFAAWRYGWMGLNYIRAMLYTWVKYPWLQQQIEEVPEDARYPSHIFFIIPSYKEEAWVTLEAFQSIFSNLSELDTTATLIVSTGSDRDDQAVYAAYMSHPVRHKVELVLQRQYQGKRIAMGHALRALARRYDGDENSVTIFMDGDSYLPPSTLKNSLPFFVRFRDLGAATTNEAAFINTRSIWYKEWFNLKFGQRHILFKSHALSNKVLTLTGRFSLFRTSIIASEPFIRQIENDTITHWMHGRFRFLMGDDKSSWYYLLKEGWNMLYLHDVAVYSLESRDDSFLKISLSLPYRWYGNTLRNNARALRVGWRKTGLFIWVAILDQRINMWTALVGITGAVLLSLFKSFVYLPFYIAWVLVVRIVQMSFIAWRGHPVSLFTLPLMLYNQWVGAIIKIKASFHLADQSWSKGGAAQENAPNRHAIPHPLAKLMPGFTMVMAYLMFFGAMFFSQGILEFPQWPHAQAAGRRLVIDAVNFGIVPDDGKDDAVPLNRLLVKYRDLGPVEIRLPPGKIELSRPLQIVGNRMALTGDKNSATRLVADFKGNGTAMIQVKGRLDERRWLLAHDMEAEDKVLQLASSSDPGRTFQAGDWLLLSVPNDPSFLDQVGSVQWRREYPKLRQTMLRIREVREDTLVVESAPGFYAPASLARIQRVLPVRGLVLSDLQLEYRVPGASAASATGVYENLHPDHAVDGIQLEWVTDCTLKRMTISMAGRHPLNLDGVGGCVFESLKLEGSWNKGKGGNGYLRIARSHGNRFSDITLENLRHLALQWSSSFNRLEKIRGSVDVNFHGGFTHHNRVEDVQLVLPPDHPWPAIYRTPENANWAPPDGPGNLVTGCRWKRPGEEWQSCN